MAGNLKNPEFKKREGVKEKALKKILGLGGRALLIIMLGSQFNPAKAVDLKTVVKKSEGERMKEEGRRMKEEGRRMKEEGRRMKEEARKSMDARLKAINEKAEAEILEALRAEGLIE